MNELQKQSESRPPVHRRQFLAMAARGGALAVMGGLASLLAVKRARLLREGKCIDPAGRLGCRQCREYAACQLPKTLSAKGTPGETHGKEK